MSTHDLSLRAYWVTVRDAPYPSIGGASGVTVALAGMIALMIWEIWANGVAPIWTGVALSPGEQVTAILGVSDAGGEAIFVFLALIGFPALFEFVIRPLSRMSEAETPTWLLGAELGAFVFGLSLVSTAFAADPEALTHQGSALVLLLGHLIYGVVVAVAIEKQEQFEI
ncbi:MAG: hypothetical protein AAFU68_11465 [Pseudomonadota bacterium]